MTQPPMYEAAPPPPADSYGSGPSGPRAGFWQRAGAFVIDALLLAIPEVVVGVLLKHSPGAREAIDVVVGLGYGTLLEGSERGQTVGKMALGIRVYDFQRGGSIGYARALIRQIVKILSGLVIGLGYLWMLWDREKQCWHDKAAGDVVVPVSAYS